METENFGICSSFAALFPIATYRGGMFQISEELLLLLVFTDPG